MAARLPSDPMMKAELLKAARVRPVRWESAALAAVCTADMLTTLVWVRARVAVEANPLMVGPLAHSDAAFLATKASSFLVPIAILEALRAKRPDAVVRALRVCLAAYVALYAVGVALVR